MRLFIFLATYVLVSVSSSLTSAADQKINWRSWTDDLFPTARREHRLVILDLEAVWCHWCHVMDEKTYADPKVIAELDAHFVSVRVDQDSRPDLSNRYENYGWPATILFDENGTELAKRSGYIEPMEMLSLLKAFVADPKPGPSATPEAKIKYAPAGKLGTKERNQVVSLIQKNYDFKRGGWDASHKFFDPNLAEYFFKESLGGDAKASANYKLSLDSQLALLDGVWGGFYQYSAEGDWQHPHFEKIMLVQADSLRMYSLALKDPDLDSIRRSKYENAAKQIIMFMDTFLTSPDGAFYTSQDADAIPGQPAEKYFSSTNSQRRAKGIPRVDQHIYPRENGWMISSLLDYYGATGDAGQLDKAIRATKWLTAHRKSDSVFLHDPSDKSHVYLGDTLAMGGAFLKLYQSTGDRAWLTEAASAGKIIRSKFSPPQTTDHGLLTAAVASEIHSPAAFRAQPQFDENYAAARFYNALAVYTGSSDSKSQAESLFSFIGSSTFRDNIYSSAAVLIVDDELSNPPLHLVVVGKKSDERARILFKASLKYPIPYKIIEWWDKSEGPLPNPDVTYPELAKPAAFVCAEHRCSFPAFLPEDITIRVKQLSRKL